MQLAVVRIKTLRARLGLTQTRLAELMGVSFATVNRWENGVVQPSRMAIEKIARAERLGLDGFSGGDKTLKPVPELPVGESSLDFSADPEEVRLVIEAERLSYGHLFNPVFATEISLIDPLPHQRIAVYKYMLPQPRLRFLLADDAGAGKTIMAGLYIREMLARRLVRRVLVVPPAGLIGNWERELRQLFSLSFKLIEGSDARTDNPFVGDNCDLVVVSVDTLAGQRMFERLQDPRVLPYDLVIFDEAHKLSARRDPDGTFRPTDRYRLAEALAGVRGLDERWRLDWSSNHFMLLTATPHMGKDFPYFCLWRLLEPHVLSTEAAFDAFPAEERVARFIRRVKEEMVYFDGRPIYPQRISDTLSYDFSQSTNSEQQLYDETTAYIEHYYNQARILNRSAARFAVGVFQRRLASSTWALLCSLKKRGEKLERLIEALRAGEITEEQLRLQQSRLDKAARDPLEDTTADEETAEDSREGHEREEEELLGGLIAVSLAQLVVERDRVQGLIALAQRVHDRGEESKFDKLREVLHDPRFAGEKVIIFTEHRDTQDFLVRRFEGLGFTGRIAQINGGMDFRSREEQVEFFRKPTPEGGAQYLICTDAAGAGINLQFAWLMINYDIPWNPARLEQRMGRIHRYGQKRDPVVIVNLIAGKTREGRVLRTLLVKLERIRKKLGSDKVFDVVGRLFEGGSLREYMERATLDEEIATKALDELEGKLTKEQVEAIAVVERRIYGEGGDVRSQLDELRGSLSTEELRRLLPGYVMRFIDKAAPKLGLEIEGDLQMQFAFKAIRPHALDRILPVVETYRKEAQDRFTVFRPATGEPAIFLHPGELVFEALRISVTATFAPAAGRGAVFVDPMATQPYLFHVALVSVIRQADKAYPGLQRAEALEYRLTGLRQEADGAINVVPVEHLLLLRGGEGLPPTGIGLLALGRQLKDGATQYLREQVAQPMVETKRAELLAQIESRRLFLRRGFDYQDAELAAARSECSEKARAGDLHVRVELNLIKDRQRELAIVRHDALRQLQREPELIAVGDVEFIAHALVVPSSRPEDRKHRDDAIEAIAMQVALAHEFARGANAKDVSTPLLARAAGFADYPGFDVHSRHPDGEERAIEVKGRAAVGEVEISENEWAKAVNLRQRYWLYVVFHCATPSPRLYRVQDPFTALLASAKGGVVIAAQEIMSHCASE